MGEEATPVPSAKFDRIQLEKLTNQLFIRQSSTMVDFTTEKQGGKRDFMLEFTLVGDIEQNDGTQWRIIGMCSKREEGMHTDYDIYRIPRMIPVERRKIKERLHENRREHILRLCRSDSPEEHEKFLHEWLVLKSLKASFRQRRFSDHFPTPFYAGKLNQMSFLDITKSHSSHRLIHNPKIPRPYYIIEKIEPSLETLFRAQRSENLGLGTSVYLTIGIIKVLRLLHSKGLCHRNVQPAHFSIRMPPSGLLIRKESELSEMIVVTDFSLCRQYRGGSLRPRKALNFTGSMKYCSPAAMDFEEQTSLDDLISSFYILYEFAIGFLPWVGITNRAKVRAKKIEVEGMTQVADDVGKVVIKRYNELFALIKEADGFTKAVDYEKVVEILLSIAPDGTADTSLFGFSHPLRRVYEEGYTGTTKEDETEDVKKSDAKKNSKLKLGSATKSKEKK